MKNLHKQLQFQTNDTYFGHPFGKSWAYWDFKRDQCNNVKK